MGIRELATKEAETRLIYQSMSQMNTPTDIDAKIRQDVQYRVALKAWVAADYAYKAAIDAMNDQELADASK